MKILEREAWNECDVSHMLAEYDAGIDADGTDNRLKVIRGLSDDDRMIIYGVADGASARMIAHKLGMSVPWVTRRIKKLKRYVQSVCYLRNGDLHR